MGRRSTSGSVTALGPNRIQFDFRIGTQRYRPSIECPSTESNLERARTRMKRISERISAGTFCFANEFPGFRNLTRVSQHSKMHTCRAVFDEFLAHCEIAVSRNEMAATTVASYRNTLHSVWRPELDELPFLGIDFAALNRIANSHRNWSYKTYNNAISVVRRAFAFGYQTYPTEVNPALGLRLSRLRRHERPRADPFRIYDAELLIAALHRDWGEAQGNFDEFRIFSGLRPSEQIAMTIHDYDPKTGTVQITKARVHGIDRDYTKTGQDRVLALNPARDSCAQSPALSARAAVHFWTTPTRVLVLSSQRSAYSSPGRNRASLAAHAKEADDGSLSTTVLRETYIRELELNGWKKPNVGRQATRTQLRDDGTGLFRVDSRRCRERYRRDQARNERRAPTAVQVLRGSSHTRTHRCTAS